MKEEIKSFFKGDIQDDSDTLTTYSHDASLLEVRPQLVLFPKDSADIQNLVKWINTKKAMYPNLAITPRAAGTDMSGGAIGESIILDFTRYMNHMVKFIDEIPQKGLREHKDGTITVQPGMYYRDFEKITLEKGLILPCYTASKSLNAVGGMFGNNSAGERTLKYGKTEDYVVSSKVIFGDGNEYVVRPLTQEELRKKIVQGDYEGGVYKKLFELITQNKEDIDRAKPKVHKNSAGYFIWNVMRDQTIFDLNKLLVGSQGTLGIATEITYRLVPQTKYSKLVAIFMNNLEPLGRLVDDILVLRPETLETYDDKTMQLAVKFFMDFLKNKGFIGMLKFMWSFLPEFKMMLTGGFPKLVILAEFAGENDYDVEQKCEAMVKKIELYGLRTHITKNQAESDKYWNIRRDSFALLRKHVKGKRTAPFIDDIIVRPEFLPKFLPELNHILEKYDLTYTIAGHAGDGNFHIIPLMDFSRPDTGRVILELSDKVYDLVIRYHGSITGEHNDGIIRTPYIRKMYGDHMAEIFKKIKEIFDPQYIFNPGKKVPTGFHGGTKEYIQSHIAIEHKAIHKS